MRSIYYDVSFDRCPLTREEGDKIAEYYIAKDGRVCYRDFCFLMENGMITFRLDVSHFNLMTP